MLKVLSDWFSPEYVFTGVLFHQQWATLSWDLMSVETVTQRDVWVTLGEHRDSYKCIVRVETMIEKSFFFCSCPLKYLAWTILSCVCPTLVIPLKMWRRLHVSNVSGVKLYLLITCFCFCPCFSSCFLFPVFLFLPLVISCFTPLCMWVCVLPYFTSVVLLCVPSFYCFLCSVWF